MTCFRRSRGTISYRCWQTDCAGCRKTYKLVSSRLVDDILADHPDLRSVWWLPVEKTHVDELADHWKRLRQILRYHDLRPKRYIWLLVETADQVARYTITDRDVDVDELRHHWQRYDGTLYPDVFERNREQLRRTVATHCGEFDHIDPNGRRIGSSDTLPGVSPRRNSSGRTTPPSPETAYATDVCAD